MKCSNSCNLQSKGELLVPISVRLSFFSFVVLLAASLTSANASDVDNSLVIELEIGSVTIELLPDVAPKHVKQIKNLAREGAYDNVVFHRVIDGFMAQTGDVEFGDKEDGLNMGRAGTGGSSYPDIPAEFSDIPFDRGVVGMARSQNPNSANSQFFIMFESNYGLNGQYTVVGRVLDGMPFIDNIKRGQGRSGSVTDPDHMIRVRAAAD
jgi:cyclophilin family peptidyl-prolyl cis-trans isomerase